jgi:peptidoglycan/LPS O-acetylase OafA/YrhL
MVLKDVKSGYVDFQKNNFDLIRIVTATLVLTNHSLAHLKLSIPFWYSIIQQFQRVPMFFVMSGFLLSASFERNSDLYRYFRNRATRIYPGLWACLLLTIIVFWAIAGRSFLRPEAAPWLLAQMTGIIYTPHFLSDFGYGSYNGSLWTIVVELQFYLVLPVIYFLRKKLFKNAASSDNRIFYILFILSIGLSFVMMSTYRALGGEHNAYGKMIRYSFLPYAYIFVAGILLQRLKIWQLKAVKGKALIWMGAFLVYKYVVPPHPIGDIPAMIMLAVCTVSLGYSAPGLATRFLKNNDLSYGVYLYHGMLLALLVELNITGSVLYYLFVFAVTFLLSWLSYKYVESPAMTSNRMKKVVVPTPPQTTTKQHDLLVVKS